MLAWEFVLVVGLGDLAGGCALLVGVAFVVWAVRTERVR